MCFTPGSRINIRTEILENSFSFEGLDLLSKCLKFSQYILSLVLRVGLRLHSLLGKCSTTECSMYF
jgi:hypothetical protein